MVGLSANESGATAADSDAMAAAEGSALAAHDHDDLGMPAGAELGNYPPSAAAGLDPNQLQLFADRLNALREYHSCLPDRQGKGGLFVLDLAEVGRRYGRRWPEVRRKTYGLIETVIARRLNARDLYMMLAAERIVLLLTDIERASAELLARRIASDITERLFGLTPGGVACRMRTIPIDLEEALAGVTCPQELEAKVPGAELTDSKQVDVILAAITRVRVATYTPVFNVKKQLISIYAMAPAAGGEDDTASAASGDPEIRAAAADRWAVAQAAQQLSSGASRAVLLIAISYTTLARMRHREPLMLACRRLPAAARRRLVIEIDGLQLSLPQARLRQLVSYLKPLAVGVVVRLDPCAFVGQPAAVRRAREVLAVQLAGAGVVGLVVGHKSPGSIGGVADGALVAASLASVKALASELQLRSFCDVGDDRRLCRAAFVAGIDHVLGEVLLRATSRPGRVVALSRPPL